MLYSKLGGNCAYQPASFYIYLFLFINIL